MSTQVNATDARPVGLDPQSVAVAKLLDVRDVAALLDRCSVRHVHRLADAGKMPRPVKLGALVRWRRADLEAWIAAGCPSQHTGGRRP